MMKMWSDETLYIEEGALIIVATDLVLLSCDNAHWYAEMRPEVREWCDETLAPNQCTLKMRKKADDLRGSVFLDELVFEFKDIESMVLFRLRWL